MHIAHDNANLMHISHLIFLVGNNGMGPSSSEQLWEDLKKTRAKADSLQESILLSYCGAYDILVYPSGSFSLVPLAGLITYKMRDD